VLQCLDLASGMTEPAIDHGVRLRCKTGKVITCRPKKGGHLLVQGPQTELAQAAKAWDASGFTPAAVPNPVEAGAQGKLHPGRRRMCLWSTGMTPRRAGTVPAAERGCEHRRAGPLRHQTDAARRRAPACAFHHGERASES